MAGPNAFSSSAPPRVMRLAVAGSALLMIAGGALFYHASRTVSRPAQGNVYKVTVGEKTCEPNDFTVPAGRATFEIHNASKRTLEWEILDGVMVLEERENITPGLRSMLTARLKPGRYEITCGLLSNPRGTLTVTASAESDAERQKPPVKAFIGPLSEYRVYLVMQSSALAREVGKLNEFVQVGDLAGARAQYFVARGSYRRLDMVTGRFSDLKNVIDPLADYLAERENDPGFVGFHRIEYGLFETNSVDGLAPVAEKLVADIATLSARIRALRLSPEDLGAGVEKQARFLADGQIGKGENRYAGSDLDEFAASLEGMEKGVDLLMPLAEGAAPDVVASIRKARTGLHADFDGLKQQAGYPRYDRIDQPARDRLARDFSKLADAVGKLNASLGLE